MTHGTSRRRIAGIGACALAAAALFAWPWRAEPPLPEPTSSPQHARRLADAVATPSSTTAAGDNERDAVDQLPKVADGDGERLAPTFLVLDAASHPVPDARVLLWSGPAASGPPALELATDAGGRCAADVAAGASVRAAHPDLGRSVLRTLTRDWMPQDSVVRLWLVRPVTLHGIVLDDRLAPIAGASVRAGTQGDADQQRALLQGGPVRSGADGRFAFEVGCAAVVTLQAELGDRVTTPTTVLASADAGEVALLMPGALRVRGVVLAADGTPAPASLTLSVRREDVRFVPKTFGVVAGRDGRFDLPVDLPGEYCVNAAFGYCRYHCPHVTVSLATPQPTVVLRLPAVTPITGRVLRPEPFRNDDVIVRANACRDPSCWNEAGTTSGLAAGADGAFRLDVPAGTTWDIEVARIMHPPLPVATGVAAGTRSLVLAWPDGAEAPGERRVECEVYVAASGAAAVNARVLAEHRVDGRVIEAWPLRPSGGGAPHRFVAEVPADADLWLVAKVANWSAAPAQLPVPAGSTPFRAVLTLPVWSSLRVQLCHDGRPVRGMRVRVRSLGRESIQLVDDAGLALFRQVAPGQATVDVLRFDELLWSRTVDVGVDSAAAVTAAIDP